MAEYYDSDIRYGSTFLDVSKNAQSIPGEIMTDKITGEVYLRRPTDNKIISFRQKANSVYEAVQEFSIQYQSASGFLYPTSGGTYLLGTRVMVDELAPSEQKQDILKNNIVFATSGTHDTCMYDLSVNTNGFFIKPMTRLGDRTACGYLMGKFSEHEALNFTTAKRTFNDWLDLSNLYTSPYKYTEWNQLESWIYSGCIASITVDVVSKLLNGGEQITRTDKEVPIKLNEFNYIPFDTSVDGTIISVSLTINSIQFPKLQYERTMESETSSSTGVSSVLSNLMEPDLQAVLNCVDLFYFVDHAMQIPNDSNTVVNHVMDVVFLQQAMDDLANANGAKSIQSQVEKPDSWPTDTMWLEELRASGVTGMEETDSENKFPILEQIFYKDGDAFLEFTEDQYQVEDIWVADTEEV